MWYLARTADGRPLVGDDDGFVPLDAVYGDASTVREALPLLADERPEIDACCATRVPADAVTFGPFLDRPGKLFGIGLNYADHAADLSEQRPDDPASFFKPATAATGPGGPIRLPPTDESRRVTAEAELAVVIGRTCRNVSAENAADVVAGYAPVIDMTAEDVLQRNPRFLTRAKSYDTFLVLGPHVAVPEANTALDDIAVRTVVNGTVRANNTVENMHFSPLELVSFHSRVMTLEPGDVIFTGTPGAHRIEPGDRVRADVDRIGSVGADVVRPDRGRQA